MSATASVWPEADVAAPTNRHGEHYDLVAHSAGNCIPCSNTLTCRPCQAGRKGMCRVKTCNKCRGRSSTTSECQCGALRCHHEDHRLMIRKGRRERADQLQQGWESLGGATIELSIHDTSHPEENASPYFQVDSGHTSQEVFDVDGISMDALMLGRRASATSLVLDSFNRAVTTAIYNISEFWQIYPPASNACIALILMPLPIWASWIALSRKKTHLHLSVSSVLLSAGMLACGWFSSSRTKKVPHVPLRCLEYNEALRLVEALWDGWRYHVDIPGLLNANTVSHPDDDEARDERFERNAFTSLAAYFHCPHIETAYTSNFARHSWGAKGTSEAWQSHVELIMNDWKGDGIAPIQVSGAPCRTPLEAYCSAVRNGMLTAYQWGQHPADLPAARVAAVEFHRTEWQRILDKFQAVHVDLQKEDHIPLSHALLGFWQRAWEGAEVNTYKALKKCLEVERQNSLAAKYHVEIARVTCINVRGRRPQSADVVDLKKYQAVAMYSLSDGRKISVIGPCTFSMQGAKNWALQWMMEGLLQARLEPPDNDSLALCGLDFQSFNRGVCGALPSLCTLVA